MYRLHTHCRACGYAAPGAAGMKSDAPSEFLIPVFDLGIQPLANDFARSSEERSGYAPLKVLLCPRCTLSQLSVVVRPDILYSRYLYVTNQSITMKQHFSMLLDTISKEQKFNSVLEVGSNDGTLLNYIASHGIKVVGIDPAENLAAAARMSGIPTITGVFNSSTAAEALNLCTGGFDVILARHVFCHVDNWKQFVESLNIASHRDTLVCIEVPYVKDLLQRGEFDTIYHEHLSYLSIKSVEALLVNSPFRIQNVIHFPIHGGAIVLMLRRKESPAPRHPIVDQFVESEEINAESWSAFSNKAAERIKELREFVREERSLGKRVVGFGASAKSTVWVNACGFTRRDLEFITDTTPQKWYTFSPGTEIPIVDEGAILRELPDYAVCFAWNYRDFILKNNQLARSKGVKFVFPIPYLETV